MTRGETYTVIYPEMEEQLNQQPPRYLNNILAHLDYCKDVCDHFGMTTALTPYVDTKTQKIVGFTAKSFQNPKKTPILQDGNAAVSAKDDNDGSDNDVDEEYQFGYDPYWDDGTDFEALYAGIDDGDLPTDPYPEIVNKIPVDDDDIIDITKQWVQVLMSDMGICPFTTSAESSGLPLGPVHYQVTRVKSVEDMYVTYWEQVVRVEQQTEKELSTTLLITPEFFMDNVELFETFCNTLTQPLTALHVEDLLQLVFFHPHWSFRDGGERATTSGQAANYARRSPWPMINLLRTNQVRAAQKGIPTGLVYKQNEKTLHQITAPQLETMLRLRDWTALTADQYKVNRREMDALKIAQDYQQTGRIAATDRNLANDALPVANRVVDRRQVEEGNLINVLQQALEKRLGSNTPATMTTTTTAATSGRLTGPETSVASMATEYLLQELDRIASKPSPSVSTTTVAGKEPTNNSVTKETSNIATSALPGQNGSPPSELEAARKAHLQKARQMLMDDLVGGEYDESGGGGLEDRGSELNDVVFGKSGLQPRSDDDDDFDAFRSFQGQ
ncbi:hypothetical protein ACA910_021337 [Epithemia clementina (nom. ined.)]